MVEKIVYELIRCGFEFRCSHLSIRHRVCFEQGVLDFQATIECEFTLKYICDIIRRYSQMQRTDIYSQYSLITWPVWPNGLVFVDELSGCGFEFRYSHLTFRCCTYFEQGVLVMEVTI